jgi:hypothetical protein
MLKTLTLLFKKEKPIGDLKITKLKSTAYPIPNYQHMTEKDKLNLLGNGMLENRMILQKY